MRSGKMKRNLLDRKITVAGRIFQAGGVKGKAQSVSKESQGMK